MAILADTSSTCPAVVDEKNKSLDKTNDKSKEKTPSTQSMKTKKRHHKKPTKSQKSKSADHSGTGLSPEELAFLNKIGQRSQGVKSGHISVANLMGKKLDEPSILDKLLEVPIVEGTVLSIPHRPPVPGFPSAASDKTSSVINDLLRNHGEVFVKTEPVLKDRSEILRLLAPRAEQKVANSDKLPPWISLAPMYPLEEHKMSHQTQSPVKKTTGLQKVSSNHSMNRNHHGKSNNLNNSQNMKNRKPYFLPYMGGELVSRGLASNELIKGVLRINQRNYEESYIDNPDGNDQMDLLIYGLQDRNRALHGDIVVVRIKHRNQWVVRDNLYQAWRNNQLKVDCDDNGKPLTIPPVPVPHDESIIEVVLGGSSEVKIKKDEISKDIPVNEEGKYNREEMLHMGAQSEIKRKQNVSSENKEEASKDGSLLESNLEEMINNLALRRIEPHNSSMSTPSKKSPPKKAPGQKKGSLRCLGEMADDDWGMPDCCLQKTAEVVFIAEQKNCRAAMGQLKVMNDMNKNWALFSPTDSRMPRMMIPADQLPHGFFDRPQDFLKFIFVARLVEWQASNQFARGRLERSLGIAGEPEVETEGLLFSNNVDSREFSPSALKSLPVTEETAWSIPEEEFSYRRDFRNEIVFTIDPKTARDLDDALHIKPCNDVDGAGKMGWEVGVHISDVTHFLKESTELDDWASLRATSVYLVHKVIPMLPRVLCEELCSLNSGVDRLTFSVIWKIDDEGNVYSNEFVRSIIRSKVKLAYEHAQDFIENPNKQFELNEIPEIFDNVSVETIKQKVLELNSIAKKLRIIRSANGSLRLDQPKLKFSLDENSKMPNGVSVYEIKDANHLVEEFMLLANMAVARHIEEAYPSTALLRRHPPPKQKVMREVLEICEKIGFPLDATSSGLLSSSLNKYMGDGTLMRSINQVLSMLMMKPMQLAQYFCVGTFSRKDDYRHYALSCPYYTHFTSPIRRYPDVMVHRFLSASLGYSQVPNMSIQEIQRIAEHCNDKKAAAKTVSEGSDEMFFGLFVKSCGPINDRGVVVNVLDAAFDVLVFRYGVIKRVYVNKLNLAREAIYVEGPPPQLILFWNQDGAVIEQTIQMCAVVDVELSAIENVESQKYQAIIKPGSAKTLHQLLDEGQTLGGDEPKSN